MLTNEEYTKRVLARASHRWYAEKVDANDMAETCCTLIDYGNRLDKIKKSLMYGRGEEQLLSLADYSDVAEREQRIIHAILGIVTEGTELLEAWLAANEDANRTDDVLNPVPVSIKFDETNLKEEFGDVFWYLALGLDAIGSNITECLEINDAKLEKRFGSTFTEEAANNRDLDAERVILEGGTDHD